MYLTFDTLENLKLLQGSEEKPLKELVQGRVEMYSFPW